MIDLMSPNRLCTASVLASIAVFALAAEGAAQTARVPDFTGSNVAWSGIGGGEFIPIPGGPAPITQDPRYVRVPNNVGGSRTTGSATSVIRTYSNGRAR